MKYLFNTIPDEASGQKVYIQCPLIQCTYVIVKAFISLVTTELNSFWSPLGLIKGNYISLKYNIIDNS